jgi:hypothetical protein
MTPEPVTPPEQDLGVRAQSVYDLEKTLVIFCQRILGVLRLDNPTLNLAQPDVVPFDYNQRAKSLTLKTPPRVERGRVPRTVAGEIAVDRLPDSPSVIVQAVGAKVEQQETLCTVRILVNVYDEHPDGGGYQDALNITEALAIALTSFGQQAIDKAYPIVLPLEWKLVEADAFPHYITEMTTTWQLPSGRPMPDWGFGLVPAEGITAKVQFVPGMVEEGEHR